MKVCPKCSRTYPDENQKFCTVDGGLLMKEAGTFDPNATIHDAGARASTQQRPTDKPTTDLNATIAAQAPTAVFPKDTGPTGSATVFDRQLAQPAPRSQPLNSAAVPASPPGGLAAPQKRSKVPIILGALLLLLVMALGVVVALVFLVIKPRLEQMEPARPVVVTRTENDNTPGDDVKTTDDEPTVTEEAAAPPNTIGFTNSRTNLDGKLAEHYVDFSFYYPDNWVPDPKAGVPGASNFAKVERRLPPDFTQENFAVGWYTSKGTFAADHPTFPQLVEILGANLAKGFPEYRKVSEGPTKINSLDGYEFRFESVSRGTEKGDLQLWGRVVFLPSGIAGSETGATLILLATSLAPELSGVEDVGEKGQMPVILETFRFGGNRQ